MEIELAKGCFKIDSANAKAMIEGFRKDNKVIHQCIYCLAENKKFPALITLDKTPTKFPLSVIGEQLGAEDYKMQLNYVALLEGEYFIRYNSYIWEEVCNNGLFDIWTPDAPYKRFAEARKPQDKFRIILLRIYEIEEAFDEEDVERSDRHSKITRDNLMVKLKRPVVDDKEFLRIKSLLETSIKKYENSPPANYGINKPIKPKPVILSSKPIDDGHVKPKVEVPSQLNEILDDIKKLKVDATHQERAHESLIERFFEYLGYQRVNDIKFRVGRVDVSITVQGKPRIVIEVKKYWNLNVKKGVDAIHQAYNYALVNGAKFVIVSNGDYYAIFDRDVGRTYNDNLKGEFVLSNLSEDDLQLINFLKKSNIESID